MDNKLPLVLFVMLLFAVLGASIHQHEVTNEPTTMLQAAKNEITFNLDGVTKGNYSKFLTDLRNKLQITVGPYGINRLQNPSSLSNDNRYFQIGLVYLSYSVSLGINRDNSYIIAYERKNMSYFFSDSNFNTSKRYLFKDTKQENLSFSGSYKDLNQAERSEPLGIGELISAVIQIYDANAVNNHKTKLAVIIQMVCEAARFTYIENVLAKTIRGAYNYTNFMVDPPVKSLQTNWGALSKGVQQSRNGNFLNNVTLMNKAGQPKVVSTVNEIKPYISVMLFVANTTTTMNPASGIVMEGGKV